MQSRFIVKGVTADDKKVILAYELKEEEFKVNLHIIPQDSLKGAEAEQLEKSWVAGEAVEFPKGTQMVNPNLNAESILPDEIRSEETGRIRNQQNEWAYQLLTAKLWESYLLELEVLKKKAADLAQYDRQLFDDSKSFWERVLEHRKERDISQERLDKIKDDVNTIFEKLKNYRKSESAEFETSSAKLRDEITAKLDDLKKQADEARANFKNLFEELKNIQNDSRKNRYTKGDEHVLRKAFDSAFHHLNTQRKHFFSDKTEIRVKGLNEVIEKMEASLERDKKSLDYMARKATSNHIQSLELQLIKVKTNMLNEIIASKEEKLKDIRSTLEKVLKQSHRTTKPAEQKKDVNETKNETPLEANETLHTDKPKAAQGE